MNKKDLKKHAKKFWNFYWNDDSTISWILNLVVAFILIKFLIYPALGAVLGTDFPIVAVVSESMEHRLLNGVICGQSIPEFKHSLDNYWDTCGFWYKDKGITKAQFKKFPLKNGFDKGDVIILWRANKENTKVGDVLVFNGNKAQPIIHRVVKTWTENGHFYAQTKGDHNSNSIPAPLGEKRIDEDRIFGKGIIRVPYLGWVKILFVDLMQVFGVSITR